MRIDLFVAPGCPGCPAAREVIEGFARTTTGVEVHEWDLSSDPGPAVGRGIFATPTLLIDGIHILPGVPRPADLERHLEPGARAPRDETSTRQSGSRV
jgi:glutaredoxin